jgi:putative hydrolase of the HAD superfamily
VIFFDIDGTLIDHARASAAASLSFYDHFSRTIPFVRENFPAVWEEILNRHFDRFCRGELSVWGQRRERMREVFADPKLTDMECDARCKVFVTEYAPRTRAYEDVLPCLETLRGRRLGIISNGVRNQQIGKVERAGLLPHFSVLLFSEDVGAGKPAPSIFLEACRQAGKDPQDCFHIGDSVEADVMPSRRLGMRGICLERNGIASVDEPITTGLNELQSVLNQADQTTEDTEEHREWPAKN